MMARKSSSSYSKRKFIEATGSSLENNTNQDVLALNRSGTSGNRYSNLAIDKRRHYIDNIVKSRRKRRLNECESSTSAELQKQNTVWLLKALIHEGQSFVDLHELKPMHICRYCDARNFEFESPTFCCDNGKIKLANTVMPSELIDMFTGNQSQKAIDFRKEIRVYNSLFSFTSFGVKIDKGLASLNHGVYTFRALGQIFHTLPPLLPGEIGPSHFQLYFWDTSNELNNRMNVMDNADIDEDTMKLLMEVVKRNPYAQLLRKINDCSSFEEIRLHICKNAGVDQRCYNTPTADQVAAIWIEGNNANIPYDRDIIIHGRDGQSHRIKHYFGCYDPLQYPLLFPSGENGWHQNIPKYKTGETNGQIQENISIPSDFSSIANIVQEEQRGINKDKKRMVSCREYYCYKFQIRDHIQSMLLYAGRYAVDMHIKLETTRLDYYRRNQAEMRSELYQGIVDSIINGETRGSEIGKRIVLPASFIGGPRDMRRRYLDAMALVRTFGKPDLFITMTCNLEWKEITDNLKEGQQPQDRPDLTARVFRAKLQDLKNKIIHKAIFGEVAAFVYVVEFQKRGLPHMHMLRWSF